jgi:tellurite resistance protein TehA-like permease
MSLSHRWRPNGLNTLVDCLLNGLAARRVSNKISFCLFSFAAMSYPSFSDISRSFVPGWFAALMGSGVLALTTGSLAAYWPALTLPATALHWFTTLLFVLLAVPWIYQWLYFRPQALQILAHPVQGSFYPTFSIALLVLAAQWLLLVGVWALTLLRTLRDVASGAIFQPHR